MIVNIKSLKLVVPVFVFLLALLLPTSVYALMPVVRPMSATGSGRARACEVIEAAITRRSENLLQRAFMMEEKFSSHSARVETFYMTRLVPSGKTLPNYEALLAAISTKKAAVEAALNTANTDVQNFNCTNPNPKADLQKFRLDMQNVIKSLKDYKMAVRNLVVAVYGLTPDLSKTASEGGRTR